MKPGSPGFFIPKAQKLKQLEVAIIGGGLAGLTAAIHLAQKGQKITLFEKEAFPRHKVCGEYLSREVLPYFEQLKILIDQLQPKEINRLHFTTAAGRSLEVELPQGGLGISRFALDDLLYRQALKYGVEVKQEKVNSVEFAEDSFEVTSSEGAYAADVVFGAFGKRSNLDRNLEREFFRKSAPWMAAKWHFSAESFPEDLVALHNFPGGYCGLSKTETGAVNVCYLATYESFKEHKDPEVFREKVLQKNPFLKGFFETAQPLFEQPLAIAQISFSKKEAVHEHMLMLGDAAGLIHPLCGNGMAMAIHSGKMASEALLKNLPQHKKIDRQKMEQEYAQKWQQEFHSRLTAGKWLQKLLLNDSLAEISQAVVAKMPFLLPKIIKTTHGNPIV